jgi:2,4-dienoyl-CoA reductase-like NADH-dependent reductase (Old Yellow Enzyme family)
MKGYQVAFATALKNTTDIIVASVGGIQTAEFANDVIEKNEADLVIIAREHLGDPYFSIHAAQKLNHKLDTLWQYKRAYLSRNAGH